MEARRTILVIEDEPHIVLGLPTAKSLEADKICGLDVGADDYVNKSFKCG